MSIESFLSYDTIGLLGVVFYISSYAALQLGIVQGSGYTYTIATMLAAVLVLVSLSNKFNLSSAIIQITWIMISIFGLTRMFILHRTTRLNPEETKLQRSKFPTITRPLMRRLLNNGIWLDASQGTEITRHLQLVKS